MCLLNALSPFGLFDSKPNVLSVEAKYPIVPRKSNPLANRTGSIQS
jgi:hypothetical protein